MTKKRKILIVDDQPSNRMLYSECFLSSPYQVMTTARGNSALDIIYKEAPDIVLLDLQLPDLSGYEVYDIVKASDCIDHVHMIIITAYNNKYEILKQLPLLSKSDVFIKPFKINKLRERIAQVLGEDYINDEKLNVKLPKNV